MAQQMRLAQKQVQKFLLTPQMHQALTFLQMPLMELKELIQGELVQNPVLEEVEKDESKYDDSVSESELEEGHTREAADIDKVMEMDDNWREYYKGGGETESHLDQEKRDYLESLIVKPTTLEDHLIMQLRLLTDNEPGVDIGEYIIGNLDENGYLQDSAEEIAIALNVEIREVERVLSIIQAFDPPGVAARDLKECLLIQLKNIEGTDPVVLKIIGEHLDELERKKYPAIAKKLGISVEQVRKVSEFISTLEPKPGRALSTMRPQYVVPDVIVTKIEDEFVILINEEGMKYLRINPEYKRMLKDPHTGEDARVYIKEKVNSALWLMRAIQQRHRTIYRVTEVLVRIQKEFL
ncbi:MAG: RNA polymerase sigma-54 factor, partial [Candidatus Omnitrophica bacterium]|nr:RNA polymerase sigma-54 factor [Candidatus Omnitrophota bacterium]